MQRFSSLTGFSVSAVAYVKYDKASSAAAAIEALHETSLCGGRGPMLKVMIAEAPTRCAAQTCILTFRYLLLLV